MEETKKPSNPRIQNHYRIQSGEARNEDYFSLLDHFAGLVYAGSNDRNR